MVSSTRHRYIFNFFGGMEIAVLLLLTVPLTAASPLRLTQRSETDSVLPGPIVQAADVEMQEQHSSPVKIIPFYSEGKIINLESLKQSFMVGKLRPRRAPQRGCQLGTCQLHNLANTLYHIRKTSGKEQSKKAKDPQGYGR